MERLSLGLRLVSVSLNWLDHTYRRHIVHTAYPGYNKQQIAPNFLPPGSYLLEVYELDSLATPLSAGQEYTVVAEWYEETLAHAPALSHSACYGSYIRPFSHHSKLENVCG